MNVAQILISLSSSRAYIALYLVAANGSINRHRKKLIRKLCYIVLTGKQHLY